MGGLTKVNGCDKDHGTELGMARAGDVLLSYTLEGRMRQNSL